MLDQIVNTNPAGIEQICAWHRKFELVAKTQFLIVEDRKFFEYMKIFNKPCIYICHINNDKNNDTADFQNAFCPIIKTKIDPR